MRKFSTYPFVHYTVSVLHDVDGVFAAVLLHQNFAQYMQLCFK